MCIRDRGYTGQNVIQAEVFCCMRVGRKPVSLLIQQIIFVNSGNANFCLLLLIKPKAQGYTNLLK